MICNKCKKEIDDNSKFCRNCGTGIENQNNTLNNNVSIIQTYQQPIMQDSQLQSINLIESSNPNSQNFNNKLPKKKNLGLTIGIIIIVLIFIVIAILAFVINNKKIEQYVPTNNWHDVKDLVLSSELYPVKVNDKWGYIDTSGNMVIDNMYDYAYYFYGPIGEVELNDNRILIDEKGNIIAESSSEFYDDYDGVYIINGDLYYNDVKKKNDDDTYVYPFENDIGAFNYLKDTGIFGFYNSKKNITGVINRNGEIIYQTNSSSRIELTYDEEASNNYNNFESRYCLIDVDGKNGIINCDSGKVIYPLTNKYNYELIGCNFIEIYEGNEYLKTEYIYQDKIKTFFTEKIGFATNEEENNYIQFYEEFSQELKEMLLDGTIIDSDEEKEDLLRYNLYNKANYLLNGKFEIIYDYVQTEDEDYYKYGIKKNGNLVLPIEYDNFYFDLDNDEYVIGYKEDENGNDLFYLYKLSDPSTFVLKSNKMGFDHSMYIAYYTDTDQIEYNLETKQSLIIDKEAYVYAYDNFIEIILEDNRKIYDSNFSLIFEYIR